MVIAGKLIPYQESYNQIFNLEQFIDWGIAGIFLLYGLKLNLKEVLKDVSNWKLHLLVQAGTFILFPALVLVFYPLFKDNPLPLTDLILKKFLLQFYLFDNNA